MDKLENKMQYEYAIIQLVPKVERAEFFNIGVILYCKSANYLKAEYFIDPNKFDLFACAVELEIIEHYLQTWVAICNGDPKGGAISELPTASRFRWLTATRSTLIQSSKVHPGFTTNPDGTLKKIFSEMVG